MRTLIRAFAIFALCLHSTTATTATLEANDLQKACREYVERPTTNEPVMVGECVGAVYSAVTLAPGLGGAYRSCVPNGVTFQQTVAVVVKWLDQRPQRWNEEFATLAVLALHDAWPCK